MTDEYAGVVVPLRFVTDAGTLSLFSTTTIFGTPVDVTLAELAIEVVLPRRRRDRRHVTVGWLIDCQRIASNHRNFPLDGGAFSPA